MAVKVKPIEQWQPRHVVQAPGMALGAFREILDQLPALPFLRLVGCDHTLIGHAVGDGHFDVTRLGCQSVHEHVDQEALIGLLEQGIVREKGGCLTEQLFVGFRPNHRQFFVLFEGHTSPNDSCCYDLTCRPRDAEKPLTYTNLGFSPKPSPRPSSHGHAIPAGGNGQG